MDYPGSNDTKTLSGNTKEVYSSKNKKKKYNKILNLIKNGK